MSPTAKSAPWLPAAISTRDVKKAGGDMSHQDDWLSQVTEPALAPELPICDPHHHLWDHRETFVRRYLLHILPKGLMRIRHFGFLANRCRQVKLAKIHRALATVRGNPTGNEITHDTGNHDYPCKQCRRGRLVLAGKILPVRIAAVPPFR